MKTDRLEKFIEQNRAAFDDIEPSPDLWNNIGQKIDRKNKRAIPMLNSWIWKAAAIILVFTSSWLIHDYVDGTFKNKAVKTSGSFSGSETLNDLADGEAYYTAQISNKQEELEKYTRQYPEIMDDLKREFRELDYYNLQLKEDLVESNANEKVIEAIMQSYRIKLQILNQVLSELKNNRNLSAKDSVQVKQL